MSDTSVPMRWKLYALVNGFSIGGKTVFASNKFFAEKLGCSERHVQNCLEELEKLGVLERTGVSQNRKIVPKGTNPAFVGGRTRGSKGDEPSVHHTSVSNSDSLTCELEDEIREVVVFSGEDEDAPLKRDNRVKDKLAIYNLFSSKEQPWWRHSHQKKAALALFDLVGLEKVRAGVEFMKEHSDDKFCPQAGTPFKYEEQMPLLAGYVKRNDL